MNQEHTVVAEGSNNRGWRNFVWEGWQKNWGWHGKIFWGRVAKKVGAWMPNVLGDWSGEDIFGDVVQKNILGLRRQKLGG